MNRIGAWWARTTPAERVTVGLAIVLLPLLALLTLRSEDRPDEGVVSRGLDAVSFGLLLVAVLCAVVSRRFPGSAVVGTMVAASVWYGMDHTSGLMNPLILVVFYQLGRTGDRRRQLGIGLPAVVAPLVWSLFSGESLWEKVTSGDWPIDGIGWPLAAVLLGELVRNRQLLLHELTERARRAEAERDAEAERRVAQERLRIARDLHDVLAHTVSIMHVQAGVAVDTLDRDPETARRSLDSIRAAGKQAMTEARATVTVLRDTEAPPGVETDPAPGIDRIPELVDTIRTHGLAVDLSMELGTEGPKDGPDGHGLDSLVELTAYRVVQEGLTNVTRHANASRAEVRLRRNGSKLVVEVSDNGTPSPAREAAAEVVGGGLGIKGMQERIEPLGGALSYGRRPEGGWSVVAILPTRRTPR